MFTGIIEAVGTVARATPLGDGRRLRINAPFAAELNVDASVAVNGACLTVVAHDGEAFEVEAVEETLAKTSLGALAEGSRVNLERAMLMTTRLDGHFVQGHVDTTGEVLSVEALSTSWLVTVGFAPEHAGALIPVGSVTLDGVSLTVARLGDDRLTVAIIPHTYARTTVAEWAVGRRVNVEFDLIGKYVARQLALGQRMAAGN